MVPTRHSDRDTHRQTAERQPGLSLVDQKKGRMSLTHTHR